MMIMMAMTLTMTTMIKIIIVSYGCETFRGWIAEWVKRPYIR